MENILFFTIDLIPGNRTDPSQNKEKGNSFNKLLNTLLLYKCLIFLLDKKNRQTEIERNTFFVTFFDQEHQDRRITFYHFLSYTTNKLFFTEKVFLFFLEWWRKRKRKKEIKKVFLPPFIYFGYVTELAWLWHWFWWIEDAVTLQCFPFHFVLHNSWGWVVSWETACQLVFFM